MPRLEKDGLITRKVYTQVPTKVEYSLMQLGKSLMPILDRPCEWDLSIWATALSTIVKNKWRFFTQCPKIEPSKA